MLPTKSYFFFGSKIALLGGTAGDLSSLLFPILNTLWLWGQFGDFVELKAWVWPLWERGWCRGPRAGPTDRWQRRRKAVTKLWPKANLTAPLSNGTRWRTDRLYADCSTHKLETPNASISLEQGCTLYNSTNTDYSCLHSGSSVNYSANIVDWIHMYQNTITTPPSSVTQPRQQHYCPSANIIDWIHT